MRPVLIAIVVIVLVVAAGVWYYQNSFISSSRIEGVIKVGAILPLSGPGTSAESAKAQEIGLRLAEEDINNTYGENKISLIVRDSALDPEQGAAAARELVQTDGVHALYSSFTQVTQTVSAESLKSKTVLFYDSCNCGFAAENPLAFQMYFDPRKECRATAESYRARGVTKVAYIGSDVPYGAFCYKELQSVLGEENVFLEFERQGLRRPYDVLIRNLRKQGAELIVSVPAVEDYVALFKGNYDSGDPLPIVCFRGHCLNQSILERSQPEWLKPVVAFDFIVDKDFGQRLAGHITDVKEDNLAQAALGYDALVHIYAGLRQCPAQDAACIGDATRSGGYQTQILSSGFGPDRILDYQTRYINQ